MGRESRSVGYEPCRSWRAWILAGCRRRTSSTTSRAARRSSSTPAHRSARCSPRSSREDLAVTHILTTHGHGDHVSGDEELVSRFGVPDRQGASRDGQAARPGACDARPFGRRAHVRRQRRSRRSRATLCSRTRSAAATSRGSELSRGVLMALPHDTHVYPGPHRRDDDRRGNGSQNPFVRVWRGADPEGTESCTVGGATATLIVWSPDYDARARPGCASPTARTPSSAARSSSVEARRGLPAIGIGADVGRCPRVRAGALQELGFDHLLAYDHVPRGRSPAAIPDLNGPVPDRAPVPRDPLSLLRVHRGRRAGESSS